MSVMNGKGKSLQKNRWFNVTVIALTIDTVSGAKEKYAPVGFTDYIAKPFSKEQIKSKLDHIFSNEKSWLSKQYSVYYKCTYFWDLEFPTLSRYKRIEKRRKANGFSKSKKRRNY